LIRASHYRALNTNHLAPLDASPDGIAILATILSAENVGCSKRIKATEHVFGFL